MSKPAHAHALDILIHRDGQPSRVTVVNGKVYAVYNIAWGYDLGDDVAHVTTNISPTPQVLHEIDFFRTDEIARIEDVETGRTLFDLADKQERDD